jgi:hypothetical protein
MSKHVITRQELADLLEHHAGLLATALRGDHASERAGHLAGDQLEVPTAAAAKTAKGLGQPSDPPTDVGHGEIGTWTLVGELQNQTYSWPGGIETYEPFEVWETIDLRGRIQIGVGKATERGEYYGRMRGYWLAFEMVNGQKRRPIVVFNEADDYETSGDLVAIIKGKGAGGRSMFGPGDVLPPGYERLPVEVFRERINGPQAFNRLAVIAQGGDRQTMCVHAALQLRLRS